jgi:hypothetical protein
VGTRQAQRGQAMATEARTMETIACAEGATAEFSRGGGLGREAWQRSVGGERYESGPAGVSLASRETSWTSKGVPRSRNHTYNGQQQR